MHIVIDIDAFNGATIKIVKQDIAIKIAVNTGYTYGKYSMACV